MPTNPQIKKTAEDHHDSIFLYGGGLLLTILGFIIAYQFVEPAPPDHFRISTGSPGNAYHAFAQEYQSYLLQDGINLELVSSAGSVENLQRLKSGEVDVAFIQGGVAQGHDEELQALGSLYFEPLWLFHRKVIKISRLVDLKGLRIGVGAEGSGTRAVALELLAINGIHPAESQLMPVSGAEGRKLLAEGKLDALFLVTSPRSPVVVGLLLDANIALMDFKRAKAYQRRFRFLSGVELPEGVVDLTENVPNQTISLLAPAATLLARRDFHPASTFLLLQAVTKAHYPGGLFEGVGEFPSAQYVDVPLSPEADRFYRKGPPLLQQYLPFWVANFIDRTIVMLLPLLTLLLPLSKILPPTYRWRVKSKVYRWYGQLRDIDERVDQLEGPSDAEVLLQELHEVEQEVKRVPVPKSYADTQYNLRLHIRLIRDRIKERLS